MNKILKVSFSLKNTYRVNTILYSIKQIPLLKKLLPDELYAVKGFKTAACVLSVLWEIASAFVGKMLYFIVVGWTASLYGNTESNNVFLHILLFLTVTGAFTKLNLFDPTRDKYYAMMLMRMDAYKYTIVNYFYAMIKTAVGFLPCTLFFGNLWNLPLWFCLVLPLSVVGAKMSVAAWSIWDYEKNGLDYNESALTKKVLLWGAVLLAAAYGLPAAGIVIPEGISMALFAAAVPCGGAAVLKIISFKNYREIYQQLLHNMFSQMDNAKNISKTMSESSISADISITSRRSGFEYLNELFVKRHKKILWRASVRISAVCAAIAFAAVAGVLIFPDFAKNINKVIMTCLPYFVFIMYMINRGTGFTRALFMNCDHSLLTYSFYKQPKFILKLFSIRLREIIKVNALPALVIGAGLAAVLYASGGTDNGMNYIVLIVSVLCMSAFFSVHYLTIYYLLQPYNAATEMKSGTYQLVLSATYFVCYLIMKMRMPTFVFGLACIAFCLIYAAAACLLVYRLAPDTFRLRS